MTASPFRVALAQDVVHLRGRHARPLKLENRLPRVRRPQMARELYPRVGFIVTDLGRPVGRVVAFYNRRGTAEQWIKEGKNAIPRTRLSCRKFDRNAVIRRRIARRTIWSYVQRAGRVPCGESRL